MRQKHCSSKWIVGLGQSWKLSRIEFCTLLNPLNWTKSGRWAPNINIVLLKSLRNEILFNRLSPQSDLASVIFAAKEKQQQKTVVIYWLTCRYDQIIDYLTVQTVERYPTIKATPMIETFENHERWTWKLSTLQLFLSFSCKCKTFFSFFTPEISTCYNASVENNCSDEIYKSTKTARGKIPKRNVVAFSGNNNLQADANRAGAQVWLAALKTQNLSRH